jgi:hypothetical protein
VRLEKFVVEEMYIPQLSDAILQVRVPYLCISAGGLFVIPLSPCFLEGHKRIRISET